MLLLAALHLLLAALQLRLPPEDLGRERERWRRGKGGPSPSSAALESPTRASGDALLLGPVGEPGVGDLAEAQERDLVVLTSPQLLLLTELGYILDRSEN